MTGSSVPDAVEALVAIFRLALAADPAVDVFDGTPVASSKPDVVCVGYAGSPDIPAVTVTQTLAVPGLTGQRESFDVISMISVQRNSTDRNLNTPRDRIFDLFDVLQAALVADFSLNSTVAQALVTGFDYTQPQTSQGQAARIAFTVHVDTFK